MLTSFGAQQDKQVDSVFATSREVNLYVPTNDTTFLGVNQLTCNIFCNYIYHSFNLTWNGSCYCGSTSTHGEKAVYDCEFIAFSVGIPDNYYNIGYRFVQTGNSESSSLYNVLEEILGVDAKKEVGGLIYGDTTDISLTIKIENINIDTTYDITYYDGGSSDKIAYSGINSSSLLTQYAKGTPQTLVEGVKTGYDFVGWYGNHQCTGTKIETITADDAENKTFYAKWTPKVYNIKYYHANTTTEFTSAEWGSVSHPTSHTYDTATQLVALSGAGIVFDGWYTNASCTGTKITNLGAKAYTSTISLYGKIARMLTIDIKVKGVYNSGIVIYILKNGAMQSQIVVLGSDTTSYTYDVDDSVTYTLLVCKPYMWSMTAEGLAAVGNKIEFAATSAERSLKLTFSGGATSNALILI